VKLARAVRKYNAMGALDLAAEVMAEEKERTRLRPMPDYGDLMTVEEFRSRVESGGFIDYDGFGDLATEDGVSDIQVRPSNFEEVAAIYHQFTHVCWYNR
jgi:hypothetical protein